MPKPPLPHRDRASLSVRLGSLFEARATGWGVLLLPIVLAIVAALVVFDPWR